MLKNISNNIKGVVNNSVITAEYNEIKKILDKIKSDFNDIKKNLDKK